MKTSKRYGTSMILSACVAMITAAGCENSASGPTSRPAMGPLSTGVRTAAIKPADASLLAINLVKSKSPAKIIVTTTAFAADGEIPYRYSDYGDRLSPQLSWSGLPAGTKSVALLMEDPDAQLPKPFIHWVLYNVPATTTSLRFGVPPEMQLVQYENARQGKNSRGSVGYFGPKPPYADGPHHYHFQVFALDTMIEGQLATDRQTLLKAMDGHVLAMGEVIGTYKAAKD